VILALDQGSSSTRCVAYDRALQPRGAAVRPLSTRRPSPGLVEHDPEELLTGALEAISAVVEGDVGAVGIATQTESFVLWERESGRAVTPVVSWQDQRAGDLCAAIARRPEAASVREKTGLALDPTFSAPKLAWLFEADPELRARAEAGELLFGDVAAWLAWQLCGGAAHVTEPSNACRSLLVDLETLRWDDGLLDLFGVPSALLPEIRPSDDPGLHTAGTVVGLEVPLAALLGDQPAALYGQGCTSPRMAALTLGTGAFLWLNVGAAPPEPPAGVLATAAWEKRASGPTYALEAFCANAGNALGLLPALGFAADGALGAPDWSRPHPVVVPAPAGLGTPRWYGADRITVLGASSTTTAADLAAAALAGVAHQIADALEAVDAGGSADVLRVGGGLSAHDGLLQGVADLSGLTLEVAADPEATARGIATLAAEAAGFLLETDAAPAIARRVVPNLPQDGRARERARWEEALEVHVRVEA
jgi:glycerol kinase